jgi:serine/threonine-protein kinase HipA
MTPKSRARDILVFADGSTSTAEGIPSPCGILHTDLVRGRETFSFEYDSGWLKRQDAFPLDPSLALFQGRHFVSQTERANFGIFLDSAPDRWGRLLLKRREALRAREEQRPARALLESDFLLGVYDGHRLGALRFQLDENGPFLDDDERFASPPWTSLRELEYASHILERDDAEELADYAKWLRMLVSPGGSLGGARPKASVVHQDGSLWIAKFPSRDDEWDVGLWESITWELARRCGLSVPSASCEKFSARHHTFLTRRFDRREAGRRLFYMSAMTALERLDGASADGDASSYLDLAAFIVREGSRPDADLEELWKRVLFGMLVSNTDDHLRNHGFLLDDEGWRLAPAFDVNPNPHGDGLRLNVSESSNEQDLDLALEVAKHFRVPKRRAAELMGLLSSVIAGWEDVASERGASRSSRELMKGAFRLARGQRDGGC